MFGRDLSAFRHLWQELQNLICIFEVSFYGVKSFKFEFGTNVICATGVLKLKPPPRR